MEKDLREPLNSLTHLIGAFLSLIALVLMLEKALALNSSTLSLVSVTIFGVSLILLYSTSSIYHLIIGNPKVIAFFRRLDHSMIFILICGSYMPFNSFTRKRQNNPNYNNNYPNHCRNFI